MWESVAGDRARTTRQWIAILAVMSLACVWLVAAALGEAAAAPAQPSQPGAVVAADTAFNTNVGTTLDGATWPSAVQPDGKIIVGGQFTTPSNSLARFNADGTPDTAFNSNVGTVLTSLVFGLAVQPDGKIVVSGFFGPQPSVVARLNADGTLDVEFNANVGDTLSGLGWTVALQPDGAILVGGEFNSDPSSLARFNADGTSDTAFNTNVAAITEGVYAVAVQPNGQILVGGGFVAGFNHLARVNADGTSDTAFNTALGTALDSLVLSIALQADGAIVVAGDFKTPNPGLARFITTPLAPTDVTALPGYQQALVGFTPGGDGGSPITNYEYSIDGGAAWVAFDPALTSSPVVIPGLVNGVTYEVMLRAVNELGTGTPSEPVLVTPVGAQFVPLDPYRAYDSREGFGPLVPGEPRLVDTGIPEGSVAVAYNLTATGMSGAGLLSVAPGDADAGGTDARLRLPG